MDVVKKLREYANNLAATERLLSQLEQDAENTRAGMEAAKTQRGAVEADIGAIESTIAALEEEREGLKVRYAESLFDDDEALQESITSRREAIDAELREHEESLAVMQSMLADLDGPDTYAAARLSAKLGSLDFGDGYSWAMAIRRELVNHQGNLRTRVQAAQKGLPTPGSAAYETARRELDAAYDNLRRSEEERLEALGRKVEANRALTDAMRENRGDNREIDARTGYDMAGQRYRAYERKTAV